MAGETVTSGHTGPTDEAGLPEDHLAMPGAQFTTSAGQQASQQEADSLQYAGQDEQGLGPPTSDPSHLGVVPPNAVKAVTASTGKTLTSIYRGVCWNRKNYRWQASLNNTGRYIYLGSYKTQEEAAAVFDRAALRVRGARARLNFPRSNYVDSQGNLLPDPELDRVLAQPSQREREAAAPVPKPAKRARTMTQVASFTQHQGELLPGQDPLGFHMSHFASGSSYENVTRIPHGSSDPGGDPMLRPMSSGGMLMGPPQGMGLAGSMLSMPMAQSSMMRGISEPGEAMLRPMSSDGGMGGLQPGQLLFSIPSGGGAQPMAAAPGTFFTTTGPSQSAFGLGFQAPGQGQGQAGADSSPQVAQQMMPAYMTLAPGMNMLGAPTVFLQGPGSGGGGLQQLAMPMGMPVLMPAPPSGDASAISGQGLTMASGGGGDASMLRMLPMAQGSVSQLAGQPQYVLLPSSSMPFPTYWHAPTLQPSASVPQPGSDGPTGLDATGSGAGSSAPGMTSLQAPITLLPMTQPGSSAMEQSDPGNAGPLPVQPLGHAAGLGLQGLGMSQHAGMLLQYTQAMGLSSGQHGLLDLADAACAVQTGTQEPPPGGPGAPGGVPGAAPVPAQEKTGPVVLSVTPGVAPVTPPGQLTSVVSTSPPTQQTAGVTGSVHNAPAAPDAV